MTIPMGTATPKPPAGSGRRERFERRQTARAGERKRLREAKLAALEAERLRRIACFTRDKGQCRACGRELFLVGGPPQTLAHCHHIEYRSAGGSDELHNRCILCPLDHDEEHYGRLVIDGDPNVALLFMRKDKKGIVVRVWESRT